MASLAGDNSAVTHVFELIGQAVGLFISTDLDDVLVLLLFFADPRFRVRQIVAGQFIGIAALFVLSVVGSRAALVMPATFVGLLGLVPIAMGIKSAWELYRRGPGDETSTQVSPAGRTNIAAVVAITVVNGGDNVSLYIPLFALRSGFDIAMMAVVFTVMTALWLALAFWLSRHRAIGAPVRRYTALLMPFVFMTLGVLILYQAGTIALFRGLWSAR